MRFYAVVSELSDEAVELFVDRQMAELMVEHWDRDEPDHAGEVYVEPVELEASVQATCPVAFAAVLGRFARPMFVLPIFPR